MADMSALSPTLICSPGKSGDGRQLPHAALHYDPRAAGAPADGQTADLGPGGES